VLQVLANQIEQIEAAITALEKQLMAWHKTNPVSQRLASIPGIGPIIATAIATTVADPNVFRSGREFGAWLGLVPRQNSTGGKTPLGGVPKRGNRYAKTAGRRKGGARGGISRRWATRELVCIQVRPPCGSRASAAITDSRSDLSRTGAAIASTANETAAALKGFSQYSAYVAAAGLNSIATRLTRGAISLSSSSHLPPSESSVVEKPVTLPPGRGKLATNPLPTGSATMAKTIGIVRVCCRSAVVVGVVFERMRSGCSATSSFANCRIKSASTGVAQRVSS